MTINFRINFLGDDAWALEKPLAVAGESVTFTTYWNSAASVASVTAKAYLNKTDVTSTVFPSGSITSGNPATLKPFTAFTGGKRYVIAVTATVDGNTLVRKFEVVTQKAETIR